MSTLKRISEKFNAWRRYRERCANCLSSPTMSCAISASAAATSKTSCATRVRATRTRRSGGCLIDAPDGCREAAVDCGRAHYANRVIEYTILSGRISLVILNVVPKAQLLHNADKAPRRQRNKLTVDKRRGRDSFGSA